MKKTKNLTYNFHMILDFHLCLILEAWIRLKLLDIYWTAYF